MRSAPPQSPDIVVARAMDQQSGEEPILIFDADIGHRLQRPDCLAGVGGFELRNACASQVRAMYLRYRANCR